MLGGYGSIQARDRVTPSKVVALEVERSYSGYS